MARWSRGRTHWRFRYVCHVDHIVDPRGIGTTGTVYTIRGKRACVRFGLFLCCRTCHDRRRWSHSPSLCRKWHCRVYSSDCWPTQRQQNGTPACREDGVGAGLRRLSSNGHHLTKHLLVHIKMLVCYIHSIGPEQVGFYSSFGAACMQRLALKSNALSLKRRLLANLYQRWRNL